MIDGIVFDLDGTLIDTARTLSIAWSNAFKEGGLQISADELYEKTKGVSSRDIIKKYLPGADESTAKMLVSKRRDEAVKLLNSPLFYPETVGVLQDIRKRHIKIAVATGLGQDLLTKVIEITSIDKLADSIISSDIVERGKPDPAIFVEAFRRIGTDPKKGMVVGDSYNDIIPGKQIGSFTVFISRDGEKLDIANANITDLNEILKLLG